MKHTITYNHQSQFIEMFGNPVSNDRNWDYECINSVAPESPAAQVEDDQVWLLNLDMIESNTGNVIEKVVVPKSEVLSAQPFDEGNVLFSKLRPYLNKVVSPKDKGYATTELVPLRPNQNKLNRVFFTYLLRSDQFVQFANDISGGTKMPRMPLKELRNFKCILPPIELQEEFAAIVRQADKSKFDGFKSQFIEMFDNPLFSTREGAITLGEATDIILGSTPDSKNESYWAGELCWITPAELSEDSFEVNDTERHISYEGVKATNLTGMPIGTVLFSTRAPIGKVAITTTLMYCNQGFKNMYCKENLNNVFLYYTLKFNKAHLQSLGTGTTFKELSKKIIESINIFIPEIERQKQFEAIYRQADKSKYYVQNKLNNICHILTNQIQLRRCS